MKNLFKNLFTSKKVQNFSSTSFNQIIEDDEFSSKSKIEKIYLAIEDKLKYGSMMIKNIIDYRSTWIYNDNISIDCDERLKELLFSSNFKEVLADAAFYSEVEGKFLILFEPYDNFFKFSLIKYIDYRYKVNFDKYNIPLNFTYYDINKNKQIVIESDNFIFGNTSKLSKDNSVPNVAYVLEFIENVHKAIKDLRSLNHFLGVNTILFKTKDWNDAQRLSNIIRGKTSSSEDSRKWKIGDGLAAPVDVSVISISKDSLESLSKEIITNIQVISGHTGVPVHLFGFPELLSNRSTAIEMAESIINKVQNERNVMKSKIEELVKKVAIKSNQIYNTTFSTDCKVTIPATSMSEKKLVSEMYSSLVDKSIISKKTFREMIPDIDPQLEENRILEEENSLDDRIARQVSYE